MVFKGLLINLRKKYFKQMKAFLQALAMCVCLVPSLGDLPHPGIEPMSAANAGGFFTTESPGKP